MNWLSKSSEWLGLIYRLVDCVLLFAVISYQSCYLSYYITSYNYHNNGWYFIFVVDLVLISLFMCGAVLATRYYRKLHVLKRTNNLSKPVLQTNYNIPEERHQIFKMSLPLWTGSLPLVWICWLFYVFVMSAKIFILHLQNIAVQLYLSSQTEGPSLRVTAEPHTIQLCLGAMTVVFLLWIEVHRNHRSNQSMDCIKELTTTVVFEIFDSIDLLNLLIPESSKDSEWDSSHSERLSVIILVLSTINLLLPTIGLFRLSQSGFDSHKLGLRMNILHNCLRISCVNIPYMVLRISFWVSVKRQISIFLLKNALFLFISIRHIVSEVNELRKSNIKSEPKDENSLPLRVMSEQNSDNVIDE